MFCNDVWGVFFIFGCTIPLKKNMAFIFKSLTIVEHSKMIIRNAVNELVSIVDNRHVKSRK